MSRVRIALISPFTMASKYLNNEPHQHYLFLPQFLVAPGNLRYKNHVKMATSRGNGFTILDNGAFEDEMVDPKLVDQLAREYNIDEVVVPDIMKDAESTLALATSYAPADRKYYQVVIQGKSFDECEWLIHEIAKTPRCSYVTTLGIPKHLPETCRDPYVRIRLTRLIRDSYPSRFQVHFLGQSLAFPKEVQEAAHFRVRSMDTSMPFVLAYHGVRLGSEKVDTSFTRPEGYFRKPIRDFEQPLVDYNVSTLINWSGGSR